MSHNPAGHGGRTWTSEQRLAIDTVGVNLLVSAAAGSGKTSVLTERCVRLVCDSKCHVEQLLVVTFTEAAAAEMKGRIEQALHARLAKMPDDEHLRRQAALIECADISTLHSFCLRLLRQHFHRAGLDPDFRVLDPEEAGLLRLEIIRQIFADRYDQKDADGFHAFIDAFGEGDDEALMRQVVSTHDLLLSLVDPEQWMDSAVERIAEAAARPLGDSQLGRELLAAINAHLEDLLRECSAAVETMQRLPGFDAYLNYLQDLLATAESWSAQLRNRGFDALKEAVTSFEPDRLPSVRSTVPGKETAQMVVNDLRDKFKKGPLASALGFSTVEWQEGLRSVLPHATVFVSLVREFGQRYRQEKDALRALDFNDLERFALRLLGDGTPLRPSAVARQLHQRYQHVLVDEYQDINEVQDAILMLVSHELVLARLPNLFCVGDVKQSIYGFRLAEPGRFLARRQRYLSGDAAGQVIDLQANFRSRAPLLDAINEVFRRLMTKAAADIEYDASQELRPGATYPPADGSASFTGAPIELHYVPAKMENDDGEPAGDEEEELERSGREGLVIARRIEEMMGQHGRPRMQVADGQALRPIEYRDIVILLRATKYHSDYYADVLRRRGIPVFNAGGGGYFNSMEVRDVLSLLRLLDNQRQDIPLAAVLRSPLSGMPEPEDAMARIRLLDVSPEAPFHELVVRYAQEKDDELAAKLRDFLRDIGRWRQLARQRPVADVIWAIYEESGYMAFCSGLENGPQRCANLVALYDRARQFGTFSKQGLYRFNQFLEALREESDAAQAPQISEAENVVRIMSIHKSKGLEFPVVFLPELGKRINLKGCNGNIVADRQAFLGMTAIDQRKRIRYPSLASTLVADRLKRQALAEELRVLYVGMTRAREHLVMVGTCTEKQIEKWDRRWDRHPGAMPAAQVLGAVSMLDWIGPVAVMLGSAGPAMQTYPHPVDEIVQWSSALRDEQHTRINPHLANLLPLDPAPAPDRAAQQVIDRLTRRYPHEPFTSLRASQPVTKWAKGGKSDEATKRRSDEGEARRHEGTEARRDELPIGNWQLATGNSLPLSAADRGTAVHLFLEHLDFARPCTPADLEEQRAGLIACKLLTQTQADAADIDTLLWFLNTEVGQFIRRSADVLLRELPINYALPPERFIDATSPDPLDQVMIRGRIDLLVPDDRGFVLIDYKTDQVPTEHALAERVELYRGQMDLYRDAIIRITSRPVHTIHLAFLTRQRIVTL